MTSVPSLQSTDSGGLQKASQRSFSLPQLQRIAIKSGTAAGSEWAAALCENRAQRAEAYVRELGHGDPRP